MGNPIMEMLGRRPQASPQPKQENGLVQAYKMLSAMQNPEAALQTLVQRNPMMQQAMQLVNSSKMSPKDLFYSMAQQQGVDPDQILSMFK